MRYILVGAGAIGASIGGLLAEAHREVVLVARGAHAQALREEGLHLGLPERELHLRLPTVALDELDVRESDVLVLAVKSQHSEGVLSQLAALPIGHRTVGETTPVLCAQNGISNEDAALRHFARVHGACVNLPATHLEPGRIEANGAPLSGVLQVGTYPHGIDATDTQLVADLRESGFSATAREDVMAWKRAKLLRNVGNALEVLCGGGGGGDPPGTPAGYDEAVRAVSQRAAHEARACLAAAHLSVISDQAYTASLADQAQPMPIGGRPRQGGSTWQSVQRRQGSVETDYLNGEIVRLGRLHQVPTPTNEAIQSRMRTLMRTGTQPWSINPEELLT